MLETIPGRMGEIRTRFAHVDRCAIHGLRIFFESAGGSLTLKSVLETSTKGAAIPDNQARDNVASCELVSVIDNAGGRDCRRTERPVHPRQYRQGQSLLGQYPRAPRAGSLRAGLVPPPLRKQAGGRHVSPGHEGVPGTPPSELSE